MNFYELFPGEVVDDLERIDRHVQDELRVPLAELLAMWRRYVAWLGKSADSDRDDFVAMLQTRDMISEVIGNSTLEAGLFLNALVTPYDSLFLSRTVIDKGRQLRSLSGVSSERWWWQRIPAHLANPGGKNV